MRLKLYKTLLFLFLIPFASCAQQKEDEEINDRLSENKNSSFGNGESQGVLREGVITEASGIAVSRVHENAIWVHNDSGNDPVLYLIDHNANILKSYFLENIENRDWEDMTIGPGPMTNTDYLYLGDIGDNLRVYEKKFIYRFPEPVYNGKESNAMDTIRNIEKFSFSYPDQKQDAEALMIDPVSGDLYVIAKNQEQPTIYRLPVSSLQPNEDITPEISGKVKIDGKGILSLITAGDISGDGKEILIKTYGKVFYWRREYLDISISELLSNNPDTLRYEPEPQGEAISFSPNPDGFFTLSEKRFGQNPVLYFYPRK